MDREVSANICIYDDFDDGYYLYLVTQGDPKTVLYYLDKALCKANESILSAGNLIPIFISILSKSIQPDMFMRKDDHDDATYAYNLYVNTDKGNKISMWKHNDGIFKGITLDEAKAFVQDGFYTPSL